MKALILFGLFFAFIQAQADNSAIETNGSIFGYGGDFTIGNSSWYVGNGAFEATYLHSIGHVMQYYGALALGGGMGLTFDESVNIYLGWSGLGINNGKFLSTPETWADYLGGLYAPGF